MMLGRRWEDEMRTDKEKFTRGFEFYHIIDDVDGSVMTELRDSDGWYLNSIYSRTSRVRKDVVASVDDIETVQKANDGLKARKRLGLVKPPLTSCPRACNVEDTREQDTTIREV